jgi:hypothetical protein
MDYVHYVRDGVIYVKDGVVNTTVNGAGHVRDGVLYVKVIFANSSGRCRKYNLQCCFLCS